jgi:hypothetical protein
MAKKNLNKKRIGDEESDAASIPTFCRRHGISVAGYYNMRAEGKGPREAAVGKRKIITKEASADWRKEREAEAAAAGDPI